MTQQTGRSRDYSFLRPAKILQGLRRRGVLGGAAHLLRKTGTLRGHALAGPSLLRINPTSLICNHTCPMCFLQTMDRAEMESAQTAERTQGLRLNDYKALFDGMPFGLHEVTVIGGGEPLVHPDTLQIMREIKRRGWKGSLITNGTLLREEACRQLIGMRWDVTRVSVHAGDRETYRTIHGANHYETLKTNLRAFNQMRQEAGAAARCELLVLFVIQPENVAGIDAFFQFAEETGADAIVLDKVCAQEGARRLSRDELREASRRVAQAAAKSRIPCNLEEILSKLKSEAICIEQAKPFRPANRCSVGFDEAFITSMGDVLPCCLSDEIMGNVRRQTFREIWYGEKYSRFRRRLIDGQFAAYCIRSQCAMLNVLQ